MHSHIMVRNVVERAFRMGITPADIILMYLPLSPLSGPLKQPQRMTSAENLAQAPARRLSYIVC
jgi:hypothetical protein